MAERIPWLLLVAALAIGAVSAIRGLWSTVVAMAFLALAQLVVVGSRRAR
jgi:hypothetical protein